MIHSQPTKTSSVESGRVRPVVLFIVGAPGVGKTTLSRALLGMGKNGELPPGSYLNASPKWTVTPKLLAAGHYTGATFDGTDRLPYTGAMDALGWWKQWILRNGNRPTVIDGARMASANALGWLREAGADVRCVHLVAPQDVLDERRAGRASNQNDAWMRGRATAAANFCTLANGTSLHAGRNVVVTDLVQNALTLLQPSA